MSSDNTAQGHIVWRGDAGYIRIVEESDPSQLLIVKNLFLAYAKELAATGAKLEFQDFDSEVNTLPGVYAQPKGCILLYYSPDSNQVWGVVAIKEIGTAIAEVKRLYIKPEGRRKGIARQLVIALEEQAVLKGYTELKLDTLERLGPAIALYKRLGYAVCDPYYPNPHHDVVYMSKTISNGE